MTFSANDMHYKNKTLQETSFLWQMPKEDQANTPKAERDTIRQRIYSNCFFSEPWIQTVPFRINQQSACRMNSVAHNEVWHLQQWRNSICWIALQRITHITMNNFKFLNFYKVTFTGRQTLLSTIFGILQTFARDIFILWGFFFSHFVADYILKNSRFTRL